MNDDVLLVNRDDIMRITSLSGNVDLDKLLNHIKTAQDIHLQPVIGSKLMDKCKQLSPCSTIPEVQMIISIIYINFPKYG